MAGFAILQLPFYSVQTPTIFFAGLMLTIVSLLLFLPVWVLYHFPRSSILPRPLARVARRYPWYFFQAASVLGGAGFIVLLTISIGYNLYMVAFRLSFTSWQNIAIFQGMLTEGKSKWLLEIGPAFVYVWAASSFAGLTTFATAVALHNGHDETIEYQDVGASYR